MDVRERLSSAVMSSPVGKLALISSSRGLVAIEFSAKPPTRWNGLKVETDPEQPHICSAAAQLEDYFDGCRQKFNLSLDLRGTPFQLAVWKSLSKIAFGTTISYAQEAALVGRPTAFRAVGNANGKNPIPIVLPCHRVVASDGTLGGYSAGLPKKKWLLAHEQETIAREGNRVGLSRSVRSRSVR